jgi:hypothetical protein
MIIILRKESDIVKNDSSYRSPTLDEQYEDYLNDFYTETYSLEQAIEETCYMADEDILTECYQERTLGTLLKDCDPVAFNVGKREWEANHNA